jgi:glycosyltransferase involved in cell wall biosynthesis
MDMVSVAIPTFNRPMQLKRALKSIQDQTYQNLEILVSDNCSGDETERVVREAMQGDPRVKYFRQTSNIGATLNFKFVSEQATGTYFMWASDDDTWDKNYIETLVGILSENVTLSLVACQTSYRLSGTEIILPAYLQGRWFMNFQQHSRLERLRSAYRESFGEIFYGIYRRARLLEGLPALDFESYELIGPHMKAAVSGETYVTKDFLFTKAVSPSVYVWTYLCAVEREPASATNEAESYIRSLKETARSLSFAEGSIFFLKAIFNSFRWHYTYLAGFLKMTFESPISIAEKLAIAADMSGYMLKSALWTVWARIAYMGAFTPPSNASADPELGAGL